MTTLEKLQKADTKNVAIKKNGEIKKMYINFIKLYLEEGKMHLKSWSGSYKHLSLNDKEWYVMTLCSLLGYKYKKGNDAPKGGVEGDWIKISKTAYKAIKTLVR